MRESAFRGSWSPNKRPHIKVAADAYASFQGETSVIACGDCRRQINYNDYITSINTEGSVDSPPGSASITMMVPDNDVNDFFSDGQFLVIPMMEVEIYMKGYYLVGGMPQYYRTFWGLVSNVTKAWSNGTTTITISCKDILRWWELTNITVNPAYTESFGSSAGGYQLFQNQFAGQNPYTVIIQLARDAMGDFLLTTGSLTSFRPERGAEAPVIASYAKDLMAYWQLKFSNISSSLVLYGASGNAYSFSAVDSTTSPNVIADSIFKEEYMRLKQNATSQLLFSSPKEIAAAKVEVPRAGEVEFFQAETQSKMTLALQARDQMGYEFYCDTTGDIIFKPPFYNLNVLPNKPISWIQDFEIIDDSVNDSETEVVTHVTSSGNAFGGVTDWGIGDEFTTPKTGVYDFHLLRRYGWRRADLSVEWAGNPRKLFYHLLDWMDRINAKRQNGTVTIPLRPEIRMGFPIWFPKYDSFFYIQGVAHNYSPGGQATTTLTLTAKRSKFIAPKNIGTMKASSNPVSGDKKTRSMATYDATGHTTGSIQEPTYEIHFPGSVGTSSGTSQQESSAGEPGVIRDPKTGKLLGYPNVVMVYRSAYDGSGPVAKLLESMGKKDGKNPKQQENKGTEAPKLTYEEIVKQTYAEFYSKDRDALIARARAHRYEAGASNIGMYDYAHDETRTIKELALLPVDAIHWGSGTDGGPAGKKMTDVISDAINPDANAKVVLCGSRISEMQQDSKEYLGKLQDRMDSLKKSFATLKQKKIKAEAAYAKFKTSLPKKLFGTNYETFKAITEAGAPIEYTNLQEVIKAQEQWAKVYDSTLKEYNAAKATNKFMSNQGVIPNLSVMVRPVSDEFGFEVIGHYRYGRSAFIDRGKLQIQSERDDISNQVSIQFIPTAGILTDSPVSSGVGPQVVDFSSQLERMQPEDYVTGASFTGTASRDNIESWDQTNENTYTSLINENKDTGLYIEADATRRAKTLAELKPTIDLGDFSQAFSSNCPCNLSRASLYTLLPQALIQIVLNNATPSGVAQAMTPPAVPEDNPSVYKLLKLKNERDEFIEVAFRSDSTVDQSTVSSPTIVDLNAGTTAGNSTFTATQASTSTDFFALLSKYLTDQFTYSYQQNNALRENTYTGASKNVMTDVVSTVEQDNILGDPDSDLFRAASSGDPKALESLQGQIKFKTGRITESVNRFRGELAIAKGQIKTSLRDLKHAGDGLTDGEVASLAVGVPGSADASSKPQMQPVSPTISKDILNPTDQNSQTFVYRSSFSGQFGNGEPQK
jgi:hypothetical protein